MTTAAVPRDGRLISTMLDVMLAGLCDPARFRRGREYARQGAVIDLVVTPGVATARVQGSRAQPYVVAVHTTSGHPRAISEKLSTLVPGRNEVTFYCDCPDWDAPCKHSIAVMVQLSERIAFTPALLATWRGVDPTVSTPRATVGSRADAGKSDDTSAITQLDAHAREALNAFLGSPSEFSPVKLGSPPAPPDAWDEPWAFMLSDALAALAHTRR